MLLVVIILFRPEGLLGRGRSARYERAARRRRCWPCWLAIARWSLRRRCRSASQRYGTYLLTLWLVTAIAAMGLNLTSAMPARCRWPGRVPRHRRLHDGAADKAGVAVRLAFLALRRAAASSSASLLGFPALRVQHHYLAFATLGFNVLVWLVMRNEEWITGGVIGISRHPAPVARSAELDAPARAFYWFMLAITAALPSRMWWILRSPWGRAFTALRENPIRAESLGVNITALHAARLRDRLGLWRLCRRALRAAGRVHRPGAVRAAPSLLLLLMVVRRRRRLLRRAVHRRRRSRCCCRNGCASRKATTCIIYALLVMRADGILPVRHRRACAGCISRAAAGQARRAPARRRCPRRPRDDAGPRGARHREELRRHQGGRRRLLRGARGRDPRRHRAERLGQIDAVQLHPRPARADRGRGQARRRATSPACAPRAQPPRRRPHVPAAAGVPAALGAREPDPRRAGASGLACSRGCFGARDAGPRRSRPTG